MSNPCPPIGFRTRQYFALTGVGEHGDREEHATWVSEWTRTEPPTLKSVSLETYEQVLTQKPNGMFADCTESALRTTISQDPLLGRSLGDWIQRIPAIHGQSSLGYHGFGDGGCEWRTA